MLTGPAYAGPPALTWARAFTSSHLDVTAVAVSVLLVAGYVAAIRAQPGARWPAGRTTAFLGGVFLLLVTCTSALGAYAHVLSWVYAAQVALLLTAVPVLLSLGQPLELALGAWPRPVSTLLASSPVRVLTFPLVGMVLVTALPFALWFTAWDAASLRHEWLYGLTHVVVIAVGFAFFWPILGADDEHKRLPWPAATLVMFVETVLDSLPGIVVWLRGSVLSPGYWLNVGRPWGRTPLSDQKLGGLAFWGIGEVIGLPLLLITVIRWVSADAREAARIDAELDAQEERDRR
jgi:cytochrome c oxidase assembly factor CtaG